MSSSARVASDDRIRWLPVQTLGRGSLGCRILLRRCHAAVLVWLRRGWTPITTKYLFLTCCALAADGSRACASPEFAPSRRRRKTACCRVMGVKGQCLQRFCAVDHHCAAARSGGGTIPNTVSARQRAPTGCGWCRTGPRRVADPRRVVAPAGKGNRSSLVTLRIAAVAEAPDESIAVAGPSLCCGRTLPHRRNGLGRTGTARFKIAAAPPGDAGAPFLCCRRCSPASPSSSAS
jgi:hypothetical protein